MRTLRADRAAVHAEDQAVSALAGMERVPLPITEPAAATRPERGRYPACTIVDMEQDLGEQRAQGGG